MIRVLDVDCNFWLCDAQLVKIDIASMANSVELRSPFLDSELINYSTAINMNLKLRNDNEKYILKKLSRKYLPDIIVDRPKKELSVPVEQWLMTYLRDEIQKTLLSEKALDRNYFNKDPYIRFVNNFESKDCYSIWTLYILEKWHIVNNL